MYLMKNHGCSYNTKVTDNDLYIATDAELSTLTEPHSRLVTAREKFKTGDEMEILTFQDLYKLLNVTEDEIRKAHIPIVKEKTKHEKCSKNYSTDKYHNTIEDILRTKGINIADI